MQAAISILSASTPSVPEVVFWCVVLIAAIIAMGVVVIVLRRKFHPASEQLQLQEAFTIEKLERMREKGQISESEFKLLRSRALGLDSKDDKIQDECSSEGGSSVD